ncbi:class I SAM-dependent methyltransferase [Halobacteriovorax sp. JY17]|uniref:class I SAM-dependent methyltransferase n=1 Tax=Halobacteriovorax sp. JY17 TaxID=2014617 RepID=UPI000C4A38DE|nr:class I SAM-dependent methyltransferase [Halobacteriovorax sp. JY17]PIK14668.1 MAG: methyltransferase type 11 [Halobacteriovorax sp. JY17]
MDKFARIEAQKQWNTTACGELSGDKESLSYFKKVEEDRYKIQNWTHDYFEYSKTAGKKVLEIGVGQGTDILQFGKNGAICTGIDITDQHLELTAKNFKVHGLNIELIKADATKLPFPDNHFDIVHSFGVIHHIPEAKEVLKEVSRVLKKGGKAYVTMYYKYSAFFIFWKVLAHGIRHLWFLKKGIAGTLSTIEEGADGINIKPYVKMYSKGDMKKLFKNFTIEDLSIKQLRSDHFWPSFLESFMKPLVKRLDSKLGWYIVCKARK